MFDAGVAGQLKVRARDVHLVRLVFHPECPSAVVDDFDEGSADTAHRIEHEITGFGVVSDGVEPDDRKRVRSEFLQWLRAPHNHAG